MIYDCFRFFQELDMLEIRLNILAPKVDKFVILESNYTFSGKYKGYQLLEHLTDSRYKDFPIEYYQMDMTSLLHHPDAWHRENAQIRALAACVDPKDDDIVIVSDLDEIPDPDYIDGRNTGMFYPKFYFFYLNWFHPYTVNCSYMYTGATMKTQDWFSLRVAKIPPRYDAGWHFTSIVSTEEELLTKIKAFAHTEFDTPEGHENVLYNHENRLSLHGEPITVVDIDESFPRYLQETWQTRWRHLVDVG